MYSSKLSSETSTVCVFTVISFTYSTLTTLCQLYTFRFLLPASFQISKGVSVVSLIFVNFLCALYRTHFHNWLQKSWDVIKMMCFFTVQLLRFVKVGLIVIILMWRSVLYLRILNWYLIKEYISTFWRNENNLTGIFLVFPPKKVYYS